MHIEKQSWSNILNLSKETNVRNLTWNSQTKFASDIYRFEIEKKIETRNLIKSVGLSAYLQEVPLIVKALNKKQFTQPVSKGLTTMGVRGFLFLGFSKPLYHSDTVQCLKAYHLIAQWIKTFNRVTFGLTKEHWYVKFIFSIYFPFYHYYVDSIQHCSYKRPNGTWKNGKNTPLRYAKHVMTAGSTLLNFHWLQNPLLNGKHGKREKALK